MSRSQTNHKSSTKHSSEAHQHRSNNKEWPSRNNCDLNTDEGKAQYACKVIEVHPLWIYIVNFFKQNEYDYDCLDKIKHSSQFKELSKDHPVPDDLLRDVFKRKMFQGKNEKTKKDLSPLGFALEHARRELSLNEAYKFKYETLIEHYDYGKAKKLKDAKALH